MDKKSLLQTQQTVQPSTENSSNKDLPLQSGNKRLRQQFIRPQSLPVLSGSQPYNPPQREQQPLAQSVPRRSRERLWLITGMVAIIAIILLVGVGAGIFSSRAQSPSWTTIKTFQRTSSEKIPTFVVSTPWKIFATCQGLNDGSGISTVLVVAVYNSKGVVNHSAIEMTCKAGSKPTTTSTEEYFTGSVYLDVAATGTWTIQIQEMK